MAESVRSGLETLLSEPNRIPASGRLGLLCNPASVDRNLVHARERIDEAFPGRLKALYSPQHGFFAEKQDNMVESRHVTDPVLGLPAFSLYGETRRPAAEMFDPIDLLLVDLQDVGTRVYTFVYTMAHCMEAARETGRKVVVLDRPNPAGGMVVEGNLLDPERCASFVGKYPIPMRHGLTIGELAVFFNEAFGIGCDLEVVPMAGWRRRMRFAETGLPWVAPSPNLPTPTSALVYPGQVIWEGTNVSEGRGTTQPFELFGAPFFDVPAIVQALGGSRPPGAFLRAHAFEPVAGKWAGDLCRGFQLHVTEPAVFRPYGLALRLLHAVMATSGDAFQWKPPPYEYEFERLPMDLILGDRRVRTRLEAGEPVAEIERDWEADLRRFGEEARRFHRYPD
ncbi:MAG: exo-beta-N-acetylmuramidase NamZ domain-containing protein [Thermodesulfobacteriota bacterium]